MELVKDLGMRSYGTQGQKKRWGLYKCPECANYVEAQTSAVLCDGILQCPACSKKRIAILIVDKAAKLFIEKATIVHKDRYDYTYTIYTGAHNKIDIICRVHGLFSQKCNNHLNGAGCPICGKEDMAKLQSYEASSTFISIANIVHTNKYDYSETVYISNNRKVRIICHTHGVFLQAPVKHKAGMGCPSCAIHGFDKDKSGILYYLRITYMGTIVYKIGVTNRTVQERFNNNDFSKITIVYEWEFSIGLDAYNKEQEILKKYKEFKYLGEPILSSGNTELFIKDILELDKEGIE